MSKIWSSVRRYLAGALALLMIVSSLPMEALATDQEELLSQALGVDVTIAEDSDSADVCGDPQCTEDHEHLEEIPAVETEATAEVLAAASGTCGDNLTWELSDDGVLTISGEGEMYDYEYPDNAWGDYTESILSVVVESGVTYIGKHAFMDASNMTEIEIPDTVTEIGVYAFYYSGLESITIPDSVTTMGEWTFFGCDSLEYVWIGSGVSTIGNQMFQGTTSLTAINVDDDNMYYCSLDGLMLNESQTELVAVPGGISGTFSIPYGILRIGEAACIGCELITEVVIPVQVDSIGDSAFIYCNALESVSIPETVTSIGQNAFYSADKLTEITIPATVSTIGANAFDSTVTITGYDGTAAETYANENGNTFISLGANPLDSVEPIDPVEPEEDKTGESEDDKGEIVEPVEPGFQPAEGITGALALDTQVEANLVGEGASVYYSFTPDTTEGFKIVSNAGENVDPYVNLLDANGNLLNDNDDCGYGENTLNFELQHVLEAGNTYYICVRAYSENAVVPFTVSVCHSYIETDRTDATCEEPGQISYVCEYCDASYVEPYTLTHNYVDGVCEHCKKELNESGTLNENISWTLNKEGVLTISGSGDMPWVDLGSYYHQFSDKVTAAVVSEGITSIGGHAFANMQNLETVSIPATVTYIENYAFENCGNLQSVALPENLTYIGERAFFGVGLTEITVPESANSIGYQALGYMYQEGYDDENGNWVDGYDKVVEGFVINGYTNGYSETYASDNGITFNSIGTIAMEGTLENGMTWEIVDGVLTISGEGEMPWMNNDGVSHYFKFSDKITSVVISEGVTTVGPWAFGNIQGITSVSIAEGVTSICNGAFYGCSNLDEIALPSSLRNIEGQAFKRCEGLQSINLPEGLEYIGNEAFFTTGLSEITIPSSVTTIEYHGVGYADFEGYDENDNWVWIEYYVPEGFAINGYTNSIAQFYAEENGIEFNSLGTIEVGGTYDSIIWSFDNGTLTVSGTGSVWDSVRWETWANYQNYIENVVVEGGITYLGYQLFAGYNKLKTVSLPDSLTGMDIWVFANNPALESVVLSNGLTSIPASTFRNCSSLTSVTIPESVTVICGDAFDGCTSLTEITLPSSLQSIEQNAFMETGLTSITIPASVTTLNYQSVGYTRLREYDEWGNVISSMDAVDPDFVINGYTYSAAEVYAEENGITFNSIGEVEMKGTITVSDTESIEWSVDPETGVLTISGSGAMPYFGSGAPWRIYYKYFDQAVIESGITEVGGYAFMEHRTLKRVVLPDTVTSLGYNCFYNCVALEECVLPDSITSIGDTAFKYCSLLDVDLPENLEYIGYEAFYGTGITSVDVPENLTFICNYAFANCQIESISVHEDNTHFEDVNGVLMTEVRDRILLYPAGLDAETYIIPDTVGNIAAYAFANNQYLKSVSCGKNLMAIEECAFYNCTNLSKLALNDGITGIWNFAFFNTALTAVEIPYTCANVGGMAFGFTEYGMVEGGFTISGYEGSQAQEYASSHGLTFNNLGGIYASGEQGNAKWTLENGLLILEGEGTFSQPYPWSGMKKAIKQIVVRDGITSIPYSAFSGCTNLVSVSLPESLEIITGYAFSDCTSLQSVVIPANVTSIGISAFYNCTSLADVAMNNGLLNIGANAFENCESLVNVVMPNTVTNIGSYAFSGCDNLETINLSTKLRTLNHNVFYGCDKIEFLEIPDSVTSIGPDLFGAVSGTYVGYDYITSSNALQEIKIGANLKSIGSGVLGKSNDLKSIVVTSMDTTGLDWVFYGGNAVNNVRGNLTITCYEGSTWDSFAQFYGYDVEYLDTETSGTIGDLSWNIVEDGDKVILTISGQGAMGMTPVANWRILGVTDVIIESGITSIGDWAFADMPTLARVSMPDTLESIGYQAFYSTGVQEIYMPDSVTFVDYEAFANCLSLHTVAMSQNIDNVGYGTFSGCIALENLALPNATRIGCNAFQGCTALKSLIIPDTVVDIDDYAFAFCSSLESVVLPAALETIGDNAFFTCTALKTADMSQLENLGEICANAFAYCSSLTDVVLPDSLFKICSSAFEACNSIEEIVIPESVEYLQSGAFICCEGLEKATINANITTVPHALFMNCGNLTELVISEPVETIELTAFASTNLEKVTLPDSLKTIGVYAFDNNPTLKSIEIPHGTTTIMVGAFLDAGLTEITLPRTIEEIHAEALGYTRNPDDGELVKIDGFMIRGYEGAARTYAEENGFEFELLTWDCEIDGHAEIILPAKAVTCLEDGLTEGKVCAECGETLVAQEKIVSDGQHQMTPFVSNNDATCTTDGTMTAKCALCDYTETEADVGSAYGHTFNALCVKRITEPTCTTQGYTTYTCLNCDATENRDYVAALGHNMQENIYKRVEATCTSNGFMVYTCANGCETGYAMEIAMTEHPYTAVVTEPTCTAEGYTTYICSECGDSYVGDYTEPAGHSYAEKVVSATCTTQGYTVHACSCGDFYFDSYTAALGHDWDEGTVTKEATADEAGEMTYTCTNDCGSTKTAIIPALGHTYDAGKVTTAATCTENGVMTYTCTTCEETHTYTEEIPANGHHLETVAAKASTCVAAGNTAGIRCTGCDYTTVEVIAATGHSYDTGYLSKAATCESAGQWTYSCACGAVKTEAIAATGVHKFTTYVEDAEKDLLVAECVYGCGATDAQELIKAEVNLEDDGSVTTTVSGAYASVENTSNATGENVEAASNNVTINATSDDLSATGSSTVNIANAATSSLTGADSATVQTNSADITFDSTALNTIADAGTDVTLKVTVEDANAATNVAPVLYAIGEGNDLDPTAVINVTLVNSAGEAVLPADKSETNGNMSVTVPYYRNTDGILAVYYLGENGYEEVSFTYSQADKALTFETSHFSTFHIFEFCANGKHDGNAIAKTVPATCTEEGRILVTCSLCKKAIQNEVIPANGHSYNEVVTAPTCTEQGYTTYTCSCGHGYVGAYEPAKGHTWNDGVETTPATADTDGVMTYTCNDCGATKTSVIPATGHEFDEGVITQPATCTTPGVKTYTCRNCDDHSYTEEIAVLDHSFVPGVSKPVTCTEDGYNEYFCLECGAVGSHTVIPATGHDWLTSSVKAADCENAGEKVETCRNCQATKTTVIPAVGHNYATTGKIVAPTCRAEGYTVFDCTNPGCVATYVKNRVAASHHYGDPVVTEATCSEKGSIVYACEDCEKSYTIVTECLPHTEVIDEAVEATCTKTGFTEGKHCDVCGEVLVAQTEVDALGHDEIAHEAKAATCTEKGWNAYVTCKNCDYTTYEEIAAKGHKEVSHEAKAATCTEKGWNAYVTCENCDYTTYEEIAAKGHSEVVDKAVEATCTETGLTEGKHCSVCDTVLVKQEVVKTKAHTEVVDKAVEATCTKTGLTEGKHCSVCDTVLVKQETIKALGHKWDDGVVTKKPTATAEGVKTYTCTVCDATKEEAIEATGACPRDESCALKKFTDTSTTWAHDGIEFAVNNGLMNGTGNGSTFSPEETMTRAMLVTVLYRNEGSPKAGKSVFTDLTQGWYENAVAWAAENGIVNGTSATTFSPDDPVTREQIATIMYRYAEYKGIDVSELGDLSGFPDASKVDSWAEKGTKWAVGAGLISGKGTAEGATLAPVDPADRASVATILMRFIQNVVEK